MMLAPGSRLGRYDVIEPLGAGGMGEVYRARDSRLGRDVALKVLPEHLARDAQRLARLEREARVLASLNHPNIAILYGIDDSSGPPALVLELVEGQTLADRLCASERTWAPVPIDEALSIARQIAAALEGAHERGIIHRDLKPSNIALRADGTVKVLDFGLAKALEPEQAADPASSTITTNVQPTALGTPAYMSPEQVRGLPLDKRADIWAFGCVLYELLTGRRAFPGEHRSEIFAKIIEREPDLDALPRELPASVRRLLRRCLEKDPRRRLRDIGDACFDLGDKEGAVADPPARRPMAVLGLAIAGTLALAAAGAWLIGRAGKPSEPILFTMAPPEQHVLNGAPVPSPAGDRLVFVATSSSGESSLWLRPLDSPVARRIAGTEGAIRPFWSPDGRFIGFGTRGGLKRVDAEGGPVQIIAPVSIPFAGATWNSDGVIVFAPTNRSPLHKVSVTGGVLEPVTALDAERGENSHRFPHFLPDGRQFLFTARAGLRENTGIYVGSLDSGQVRWLMPAQSPAIYVASGHLLFVRDGALLAQRFDPRTLELSGDVLAIYGGIQQQTQGASAAFAASADGTVLSWASELSSELAWFDRSGAKLGVIGPSANYEQLRLAPNGKRAAVVTADGETGNRDIWVVELDSGALTRLTSHAANDWFPVWSPDGTELLFASDRNQTPSFYRAHATGPGQDELVFQATATQPQEAFPTDWSADGRHAVFHAFPQTRSSGGGIWLLPLRGDRTPARLIESPFTELSGTLSPDGRWLAYMSDESGVDEVYVQSLTTAQRYRISADGGSQPRWRRDGRELFFVSPDNRLMSADVMLEGEFAHSPPKPLFTGCGSRPAAWEYHYDVTANGERSYWLCPATGGAGAAATVAVDWMGKLGEGR